MNKQNLRFIFKKMEKVNFNVIKKEEENDKSSKIIMIIMQLSKLDLKSNSN